MSTPDQSIRDQHFDSVKAALQAIDSSNGAYFYTVEDENVNIVYGTRGEKGYTEPYIYIYPEPEMYSLEKGERGKWYKTLGMSIEAWIRSEDKSQLNVNVNRMLHDMEKALMVLVAEPQVPPIIDLRLVSNEVYIEEILLPQCAVVLRIEVDYMVNYDNPSDYN